MGKSPEPKILKHGKSLLAYACATLRTHNENKIRGKVVISLESVTRLDIREVIMLSLVLLVGHLNTFLALQLRWYIFLKMPLEIFIKYILKSVTLSQLFICFFFTTRHSDSSGKEVLRIELLPYVLSKDECSSMFYVPK